MANLGQIRALIRAGISQEDTTNTDLTDSQLNGYANIGVRELGALVKKPIDHVSVQAEQGVPAYTLPADTVIMTTAYFGDVSGNGDVQPLRIIPEEELRQVAPGWMSQATASQGRPSFAVLIDRLTVLVYPTPSAIESVSGKKIHIGYVYQPAILVSDSDIPDLPIVYHDLISRYAISLAWSSKLGKPELGAAILQEVYGKAKKLEGLIVKDSESPGFYWGSFVDTDDGDVSGLRIAG